MNADDMLEELRDVLAPDDVELRERYEVWVLPERARTLGEARPAEQVHHQVWTSSGLIYARASRGRSGELELDEIGNQFLAERIAASTARLEPGNHRLLLVPARQVIALWDPDQTKLAVVLPMTGSFPTEVPIDQGDFERLLGQVPAEIVDPPLRDKDTWRPPRQRAPKTRDLEVYAHG